MPNGVICDTRNLEAKGFGFIKPDAGKTCAGGIKGQILRLLYSCASTARLACEFSQPPCPVCKLFHVFAV